MTGDRDAPKATTRRALADGDISTTRSRRGFVGGLLGGAAVAALAARPARAETDSDVGRFADPVDRGRGAITDGDREPAADAPGLGRGPRRNQRRPATYDQDEGKDGDVAAPLPRGAISDRDSGPLSDRRGEGRGPPRGTVTDSDTGPTADPIGGGRGARDKPGR